MLSHSVGYACTALGLLAARGEPMLIHDIAREGDIPASYLGKLVNTLSRKGVVQTRRGIGGGVGLAEGAAEMTLYEVCEMFGEPAIEMRCMLSTAECSEDRPCPCHDFWTAHRADLIAFLKSTTIRGMAEFETRDRIRRQSASTPRKIARAAR